MTKVIYKGDRPVKWMGIEFTPNKSISVDNERLIELAEANPFFEVQYDSSVGKTGNPMIGNHVHGPTVSDRGNHAQTIWPLPAEGSHSHLVPSPSGGEHTHSIESLGQGDKGEESVGEEKPQTETPQETANPDNKKGNKPDKGKK